MCWYSFAVNYDFMNAALVFLGRPHNQFRSWAQKFNFKIYFLKNFSSVYDVEKRMCSQFAEIYVLCMYNIFLIKEHDVIFRNNFTNANIISKYVSEMEKQPIVVYDSGHDELVPIVKFNFANEDLITDAMINNSTAENPFLAEKKALEESVNEIRLDALYRRCREFYRTLMEGCYEK